MCFSLRKSQLHGGRNVRVTSTWRPHPPMTICCAQACILIAFECPHSCAAAHVRVSSRLLRRGGREGDRGLRGGPSEGQRERMVQVFWRQRVAGRRHRHKTHSPLAPRLPSTPLLYLELVSRSCLVLLPVLLLLLLLLFGT